VTLSLRGNRLFPVEGLQPRGQRSNVVSVHDHQAAGQSISEHWGAADQALDLMPSGLQITEGHSANWNNMNPRPALQFAIEKNKP
jgi:hypothetical protein